MELALLNKRSFNIENSFDLRTEPARICFFIQFMEIHEMELLVIFKYKQKIGVTVNFQILSL